MTDIVITGKEARIDVIAGDAFTITPKFIDKNDVEYTPGEVHTKVTLKSDGSTIEAETEVSSWTIGTEIAVESTHTAMQTASAKREEHVFQIIGDTSSATAQNILRAIIGCVNPDR